MLTDTIRLHMNEMPHPPPQRIVEAARHALTKLNRYTDLEDLQRLRERLAHYAGVPESHVTLSPGSDLLLRELVHTFSPGRKVVTVSPSFLPTVQAVKQFAPRRLYLRLRPPTFDLNLELLMAALNEASLLIVDNPNNPTGRMLLERHAVETILNNHETLLVIDEAYYEFSNVTFADMVTDFPRLAVVRTMDKAFGLAGARVGYAIVGQVFSDALSAFHAYLPQPSLYAALEALRDVGYMRKNVHQLVEGRERLRHVLEALGVDVHPSSANFLLFRTRMPDVARRLRGAGVLVANVSEQLPPGFIRVSVSTPTENDAFLTTCMEICEASE